ncbi:glycine receptor subunit alphaZ1-like isoform X2 [Symsagittifera roscoffensis]
MDYKATIFLRQMWVDPRLQFTEYNTSVSLTPSFLKKLWVPDTFIINEKAANFHQITTDNKLLRLKPNGELLYSARITLTLSCPMQLQYFPMDQQKCVITLESYAYTTSDIQFKWSGGVEEGSSAALDLDKEINLPQFHITNYSTQVCTRNYATGAYPCLEAQFFLKRLMRYYLIQTYVPSFLIVTLSWVSFWISAEASPARVALGITTVLTMTTQSSGVLQSLPKVSYVKAIDLWMAVCLLFVFAALIEFAIVNYFSRKMASRRHKKAVEKANKREKSANRQKVSGDVYLCLTDVSPRKEELHKRHVTDCNGTNGTNGTSEQSVQIQLDEKEAETQPIATIGMAPPPPKEDLTNLIDSFSRVAFPTAFLFFNILYWVAYLSE